MRHHKSHFLIAVLCCILCWTACGRGSRSSRASNNDEVKEDSTSVVLNSSEKNYPPLDFKLYLERSGSMTAFDHPSTKGEFKRAVSDMLSHIPSSANDSCIYVVNDGIYRFPKGIRDFITERDFFGATKDYGDSSHTDFQKIFSMILEKLGRQDVAILISDFIYSVNDDSDIHAQKVLNEASAMASAAFRNHPDVEVSVIKFLGDYHGAYYPYNSPRKGVEYSGERPFYAMILASKDAMEALMNDPQYADFMNFSGLKGYQDMVTFTNKSYSPDYSVILTGHGKNGRYDKDRSTKRGEPVHAITNAAPSKKGFSIPIAVNLAGIPMTANYKSDKDNYEIQSLSDYEIEEITPLGSDNKDKSVTGATHIILLNTDEPINNETVEIKLKNIMPKWVKRSSSEDDTDLGSNDFSHTTFSFGPMMEGIRSSILSTGDNHYIFSLPIQIKK